MAIDRRAATDPSCRAGQCLERWVPTARLNHPGPLVRHALGAAFLAPIPVFQEQPVLVVLIHGQGPKDHRLVATLANEPDPFFQQVMFQRKAFLLDQIAVIPLTNELVEGQALARG